MYRFLPLVGAPSPKTSFDTMALRSMRTWIPRNEDETGHIVNIYGQLAPQDLFVCLRVLLSETKEHIGHIRFDGKTRIETLINIDDDDDTRENSDYMDGGGMFDITSDTYNLMNSVFFDFTTSISDKIYPSDVEWHRSLSRSNGNSSLSDMKNLHSDFVEGTHLPMYPFSKYHHCATTDWISVQVGDIGTVHCMLYGHISPLDSWIFIILEVLFGGPRSQITWNKDVLMCTLNNAPKMYTKVFVYQQIASLYATFRQHTFLNSTNVDMDGYTYHYTSEIGSSDHSFRIPVKFLVKSMNYIAPNVQVRNI